MRSWFIAAALIAISGSGAFAQSRPDTLRMSCGQAASIVRSRGSAVLATGPNIYDKYVTSCLSCFEGDFLRPAYVTTADSNSCSVGYVCRSDAELQGLERCGPSAQGGVSLRP